MTFRGLYYEKITKWYGYRKGKNAFKNSVRNFKHKEATTTMTKNKETYDARRRQSNIRSHTKRGRFCLIIKFLPHQVMCEPIQW